MPAPLPLSYTIITDRIILRIPKERDIPRVFSATRFAGFNDGMQWGPPTSLEEMKAPYERGIKAWETGEAYGFTIAQPETDELLGRISNRPTEGEEVWNVGFWTHPEVQRRGIMSEALSAVLALGFNDLHAKRIEAAYATWNTASEKVLLRAGFKFVRTIDRGLFKNDVWVPENLVAISREAWKSST
jgi:ribosomal-protein-alanine N-acetyltransferase